MNTRQIATAILIALSASLIGWKVFATPEPVVDNEVASQRQFIASQAPSASILEDKFGIPMSVSITVAAMVTEFGEDEQLSPNNAYFLLEVDSTSTVRTDTLWVGDVAIRAYQSPARAYLDWARELMRQDFYPLVKGKPINVWLPYMEKWGYNITDMYQNFPELQAIDTLFTTNSKFTSNVE